MCINSVKNHVIEPRVILELQQLFENFQKRENYSHSFLLGVTNHWVSAVAIKLGKHLEVVLMDSRNNE